MIRYEGGNPFANTPLEKPTKKQKKDGKEKKRKHYVRLRCRHNSTACASYIINNFVSILSPKLKK